MGKLIGASIDNVGHSVTHLLFADDCFIVTRSTRLEVRTLQRVIQQYYAANDQSINYSKSVVYFDKGVNAKICHRISKFLSIKSNTMSFKYLGIFVSVNEFLLNSLMTYSSKSELN